MCLIYNKVACDSGIQNAAQELHSVYQVMPDPILKEKNEEKNKEGWGAEKNHYHFPDRREKTTRIIQFRWPKKINFTNFGCKPAETELPFLNELP